MSFVRTGLSVSVAIVAIAACAADVDGVTFASFPGQVFVPLREAAAALSLDVTYSAETNEVGLGDLKFKENTFVTLLDGTKLVPLSALKQLGATFGTSGADDGVTVVLYGSEMTVRPGTKRVEVSKKDQVLRAWQGKRLVMETNISSGRPGHTTPSGRFKAGPVKSRMHYSRLYDNAPMPWSVQINGDVFIHGYHSVPRRPASHGCIRMPLTGNNPAKWFYNWVDLGTPVVVATDFEAPENKPAAPNSASGD